MPERRPELRGGAKTIGVTYSLAECVSQTRQLASTPLTRSPYKRSASTLREFLYLSIRWNDVAPRDESGEREADTVDVDAELHLPG
jgi:hypothetical protein